MIKFAREKEALEALEAIEAYVKERLTDARLKASRLQSELAIVNQAIKVLESRAQSLQISKTHWMTPISPDESIPTGAIPTDSLDVIVSILKSSTGPMRVRAIGEYAFKKGLIASSRGLTGVISIVSNRVSLNAPKIFTNVGWGWWDLTERRNPKTLRPDSEPKSETNDETQADNSDAEPPTVH
jgi:hypothetical protein